MIIFPLIKKSVHKKIVSILNGSIGIEKKIVESIGIEKSYLEVLTKPEDPIWKKSNFSKFVANFNIIFHIKNIRK